MNNGINKTQIFGFQSFWGAQDRKGIPTSSEARGVDGFRAQKMQDQVAFQTAESMISSIGDWASSTLGSLFGGPTADGASSPVADTPAQSAAVTSLKGTGNGLLGRGSSGPEVEALQEMLKAEGYDLGDAGVDGQFGPKTQAAVEAFQRDQGAKASDPDQALAVDGIVGAQTRAALGNEALARADKMDDTVGKLNEGGSRGGSDATRAAAATQSKVDSVMDKHAEANAAPSKDSKSDSGQAASSGADDSKSVDV